LIKVLANTDNDEIFSTDQIRVLIEFLWEGYFFAILKSLFAPYLLFFSSFVAYATYYHTNENRAIGWDFCCQVFCILLFGKTFVTFSICELIQFRSTPARYFQDFWNIIDFAALLLTGMYMYRSLSGYNDDATNVLGSVAVFLLWIKLFYWMRLFKPFSAFIRIITEIVKDIQVFFVMLMVCLGCFSNVLMILDLNREMGGTDTIVENFTGYGVLNGLLHAYMTGLGEFQYENYSTMDKGTIWVFFLIATLMIQLVFMNMLIAIMTDSFSRITAIQQQSTLKELCTLMHNYCWLLSISEVFKGSRYIVWLSSDNSVAAGTVMERQIVQLRDTVEERVDQSDQMILRQMNMLDERMTSLTAAVESIQTALNKELDK